jgi:hypothetical protein
MRPRKNEVQHMVELLEAEHEDVEELAFRALDEAWELMRQREVWCMIVDDPGAGTVVWGPYESESQVRRAVGKEIIASSPGAKGTLARLYRKAQ